MAEVRHNMHHLGRSKCAPAVCITYWTDLVQNCFHIRIVEVAYDQELAGRCWGVMFRKTLKYCQTQDKIISYLSESWVNTTGKYSFD